MHLILFIAEMKDMEGVFHSHFDTLGALTRPVNVRYQSATPAIPLTI